MEIATTWAEKRTMLRNISKVGTFVRKSMHELCHDEVLLALEARVQNCRGLAQASAKGLRTIMETMTFGNHFITLREAFHLYSLLFVCQVCFTFACLFHVYKYAFLFLKNTTMKIFSIIIILPLLAVVLLLF